MKKQENNTLNCICEDGAHQTKEQAISYTSYYSIRIGYVILAGMMSIKWSLLYKMTGSLWLGLGDHLFNNLASNLVHVISNSDVDSLQIVRILLWQLLSFALVLWGYQKVTKI